jgi:hypothetical protein
LSFFELHRGGKCIGEYVSKISAATVVVMMQQRKAKGRAVAQAVSCWLPTAAARVCVRAEQVGFVVDKAAPGQFFSEYFGFPCQSFQQFLHHNHLGLAQ